MLKITVSVKIWVCLPKLDQYILEEIFIVRIDRGIYPAYLIDKQFMLPDIFFKSLLQPGVFQLPLLFTVISRKFYCFVTKRATFF